MGKITHLVRICNSSIHKVNTTEIVPLNSINQWMNDKLHDAENTAVSGYKALYRTNITDYEALNPGY